MMNFNDVMSGFITLFALMVVNNWYVIVLMYSDVTQSVYDRFFFLIFYYFGVIIGLNIVIAFAIDMYSAVLRMDKTRTDNEDRLV